MDSRIKKVLDYVEDNLARPANLANLAAIACLSPSQFHRIFKQETSRTLFKFIEELKMNKAYQLLIDGKIKVHQMALRLGYNDYEPFSRAFKKYFLLSPDDFKSIAAKVKEQFQTNENDKVIIATLDSEPDQESLLALVQQIIQEKNLSKEELSKAQLFKISPKSNETPEPLGFIKNKYAITRGEKIWESLINQ